MRLAGGRASPGPVGGARSQRSPSPLTVFEGRAGVPGREGEWGGERERRREREKGEGEKWERGRGEEVMGREGREGSVPLQFLPVPPTF